MVLRLSCKTLKVRDYLHTVFLGTQMTKINGSMLESTQRSETSRALAKTVDRWHFCLEYCFTAAHTRPWLTEYHGGAFVFSELNYNLTLSNVEE